MITKNSFKFYSMKNMLLLLFILTYSFIYSQTQSDLSNIADVSLPVSPTATALGSYGNIPINTATGQINYVIPFYTINQKGYKFPIYLSYNYAGLKVDEKPSTTGIGWSLIGSGVIVRQIRGGGNGSYASGASLEDLYDADIVAGNNDNLNSLENNAAISDMQPDKFLISVNGINTSFFLNRNKEAFFTNNDSYKLLLINSSNIDEGFIFIDDKGIQYIFNEAETSQQHEPTTGVSFKSTWFLTEIKLPSNEIISFLYEDSVFTQSTRLVKTSLSSSCAVCPGSGNTSSHGGGMLLSVSNPYIEDFKTVINTKRLINIIFTEGKVDFLYETTEVNGNAQDVTAALTDLIISRKEKYNATDYVQERKYTLNYNDKTMRWKKLNSINHYDNEDEQQPFYSFEYYNYNIDFFNSFDYTNAKDKWGYAAEWEYGEIWYEPDFEETLRGALSTIHYPSGGKTVINYELNRKLDLATSQESCEVFGEDTVEFFDNGYYEVILHHPQVFFLWFTSDAVGDPPYDETDLPFQVFDNDNNDVTSELSFCEESVSGQYPSSCEEFVAEYNMNASCNYKVDDTFNYPLSLSFIVDETNYAMGWIQYSADTNSSPNYHTTILGGLRATSIEDYSSAETTSFVSKNYSYSKGVIMGKSTFSQHFTTYSYCESTGELLPCNSAFDYNRSLPNISAHRFPIIYKEVTTTWNDHIHYNGKQIDYFDSNNFSDETEHWHPFIDEKKLTNTGKLVKSELYNADDDIIKENSFSYQDFEPNYPVSDYKRSVGISSVKVRNYDPIAGQNDLCNSRWEVNQPYQYNLTSQTQITKENGNEISTVIRFDYDQPQGNVKEKVVEINDEEWHKTVYEYPYNTTVAGASFLVDANMVNEPVKTINYISYDSGNNYEKVSENVVEYDKTTTDIVVVKRIKKSKGIHNLEESIIFNRYDENNGNPLEVFQPDGTHICYIWGYGKTKPIAKITNATYDEVQSVVNISNLHNLSDADFNETTEEDLRDALNQIRNDLPDAQIITYTYDPLIGVTSSTQPNGETTYYEYDSFNRLKFIKNSEKKILKENEYHYKE